MARRKKTPRSAETQADVASELRIIGGEFRGSRLEYPGQQSTRPMKHRVREAIFNLLGTDVAGKHAIDVFAGTGAIGLEALSRGARSATFIERHVPMTRVVRENIQRLGVEDRCELLCTSAFLWAKRLAEGSVGEMEDFRFAISSRKGFRLEDTPPQTAWVVFCSPPYDFFIDRRADMIELIGALLSLAPGESVFVVEADERFDFNLLPVPGGSGDSGESAGRRAPTGAWRVRDYPPAHVGILRLGESDES